MPRVALGLAYDGIGWLGWQTQPGGRTIQDALEAALRQFVAGAVKTVCAGRTDTGVHALCQVVHFDVQVERRLESWVRGLNALLPGSIAVHWARIVPESFHARFSATERTYVYVLRNSRVRSPFVDGRAGWFFHALDIEAMRAAAARLTGLHDFSAFRSSECQARNPVRNLRELRIERSGEFFMFEFTADAFLQHMVRNLMGLLVSVGQGRTSVASVDGLLEAKDRRLAPATFSPEGLYLAQVEYPSDFGLPGIGPREALMSHLGYSLL